jgi:hypothetical protein
MFTAIWKQESITATLRKIKMKKMLLLPLLMLTFTTQSALTHSWEKDPKKTGAQRFTVGSWMTLLTKDGYITPITYRLFGLPLVILKEIESTYDFSDQVNILGIPTYKRYSKNRNGEKQKQLCLTAAIFPLCSFAAIWKRKSIAAAVRSIPTWPKKLVARFSRKSI